MQKKVNEKGVTLIALIVTIVVLLILAGISISAGSGTIKKAQLEELRSNMLLIQAKAKEYVEEANFKMGINKKKKKKAEVRKAVYEDEAKLKPAKGISAPSEIPVSEDTCYQVTEDAMKLWGINGIELNDNEYYLINFNDTDATLEVYNTQGYDGKYSLTEIDKLD